MWAAFKVARFVVWYLLEILKTYFCSYEIQPI